MDEVAEWSGREFFDAGSQRIGTIIGLGYPRRKFGVTWLLAQTESGRLVLVPADHMTCTGERLVLPYPKGYIETAPAVDPDRPLSQEEERRLRLHYGIGFGSENMGCAVGCGMCMVSRLDKHRRSTR